MSQLSINTTQNVPIFFTTASIGQRLLAYAVDMVIKVAYLSSLVILLRKTGILEEVGSWDHWSQMAFFLLFYMPVAFYSLLCESLMEGRTLGKKLLKIKVVKIDGYQASFGDYVMRWLFRLVDIDVMYLPGVLSMLFSKHTQRLGDLAAGTAVITEKEKYNISHTILADITDGYVPSFTQAQILRFSDNDMRIIKESMTEAVKNQDLPLMQRLVTKLEEVMQIRNPFAAQKDFLQKVIEDYSYYTGAMNN